MLSMLQRFIQAFFYGHWKALETEFLIEFLKSIFEGPNSTTLDLHLNQTQTLTLNHNFVVKNNKTDKKQCYSIPRTEILLILRCQHVTRQIISNFQIWHSPNRQLSSHYRDQCWARKFNTAVMWALVTTSLPMDAYISNVWNHDLPVA